jgi:hypothetical protein
VVKVFAFPDVGDDPMSRDPGDSCSLLPVSLSQKPHPASDVLLQTKGEVPFDRAVTARSKLFRTPL